MGVPRTWKEWVELSDAIRAVWNEAQRKAMSGPLRLGFSWSTKENHGLECADLWKYLKKHLLWLGDVRVIGRCSAQQSHRNLLVLVVEEDDGRL